MIRGLSKKIIDLVQLTDASVATKKRVYIVTRVVVTILFMGITFTFLLDRSDAVSNPFVHGSQLLWPYISILFFPLLLLSLFALGVTRRMETDEELYKKALALTREWGDGRQGRLARELSINYARAGYLINTMQARGDIPPEWDHVWESGATRMQILEHRFEELTYRISKLFRRRRS